MHRMTCIAALTIVTGFLAGCPAAPKPGYVHREWSRTLRELGIQPVFPPREDVQVGDMYLRRGAPGDDTRKVTDTYVPIDMWVSHADLQDPLKAFYGQRFDFPVTDATVRDERRAAGGDDDDSGDGIIRVPTRGSTSGSVFDDHSQVRLRQVAFPDFASMTIKDGSLRGLVPVEALSIAFGADWSSKSQVDVKIPMAESYGVPTAVLLGAITKPDDDHLMLDPDATRLDRPTLSLLAQGLEYAKRDAKRRKAERADETLFGSPPSSDAGATPPADEASSELLFIDVLHEVYYTRVIDISISQSSSSGAGGGVKPVLPSGGGETPPRSDVTGDGDDDERPRTVAQTAQANAKALNRTLDEIEGQSHIGGTVRFLSASAAGVQMRRTYEQPIAIGFRSITLAVNPKTGRIEGGVAGNFDPLAQVTGGVEQFRAGLAAEAARALNRPSDEVTVQAQGGRIMIIVEPAAGATPLNVVDAQAVLQREAPGIATRLAILMGTPVQDDDLLRKLSAGDFTVEVDAP